MKLIKKPFRHLRSLEIERERERIEFVENSQSLSIPPGYRTLRNDFYNVAGIFVWIFIRIFYFWPRAGSPAAKADNAESIFILLVNRWHCAAAASEKIERASQESGVFHTWIYRIASKTKFKGAIMQRKRNEWQRDHNEIYAQRRGTEDSKFPTFPTLPPTGRQI